MQRLVKIAEDGTWERDSENPIYYMVKEEKVALPLYPQFGTEPNGYYIPPRWVPLDYLIQMFGPGAEHAIEAYVCPSRRMLGLLPTVSREPKGYLSVQVEGRQESR